MWIETLILPASDISILRHTLRGCVDWNIEWGNTYVLDTVSHPSWVCGLKQKRTCRVNGKVGHTLRGCVDWNSMKLAFKPRTALCHTLRGCVDWNRSWEGVHPLDASHTLRGCVDWNNEAYKNKIRQSGHTLRGCVDWNWQRGQKQAVCPVTPFVGVWIETYVSRIVNSGHSVTPFVGVWIETLGRCRTHPAHHVTPFVGVWIETCHRIYGRYHAKSHPSWVCGLKQL